MREGRGGSSNARHFAAATTFTIHKVCYVHGALWTHLRRCVLAYVTSPVDHLPRTPWIFGCSSSTRSSKRRKCLPRATMTIIDIVTIITACWKTSWMWLISKNPRIFQHLLAGWASMSISDYVSKHCKCLPRATIVTNITGCWKSSCIWLTHYS